MDESAPRARRSHDWRRCDPHLYLTKRHTLCFPNMRTSVITISLAQSYVNLPKHSTNNPEYLLFNCPRRTQQVAGQQTVAHVWPLQGRSTAFLSLGFCCGLCAHGETRDGGASNQEAPRSAAINGDPTNPLATLIGIDHIAMM